MKKTLIIAHRGVSKFVPENTMPAFELAFDMECDGIEFDVHLSKDGIPVIIHDETLDRTSNGKGYVKDYTFDELQTFDFGIKFDPAFNNTSLPTLEAILEKATHRNFKGLINIELKNDIIPYYNLEEKVLSLIGKYNIYNRVLISSFNHDSIRHVKKLDSQIKVALLYYKAQNLEPIDLHQVSAYSANLYYIDVTKEIIEDFGQKNILTFAYTVDKEEDLRKLIGMNIGGIFSNDPEHSSLIRNELQEG